MVSFMNLEKSSNQKLIKETKNRLKNLNERIMGLDNGRNLVKNVLHNSYWKYKVNHFKQ